MIINTDLHSHSVYAGGAGAISLNSEERDKKVRKRFTDSSMYAPLKGVDLIGTGDCQFEPWLKFLRDNLEEVESGIFSYIFEDKKIYPDNPFEYPHPKYLLQSEFIVTGPAPNTSKKKKAHILILFPNFSTVEEFNSLLDKFKVSRKKIARPYIVNNHVDEIEYKLNSILDIDPLIEVIPAHILTPEGVYGSNQRINYLDEFFGSATNRITAVETGLSADPKILGLIPELDNFSLISNADAHSASLNRVGREFTSLEINKFNYEEIIRAIRNNKVKQTAEFHPTEGRYFLTGHRGGRKRPGKHKKNQYCCYSPKFVPKNDICPQCNRELTVGVLSRAFEICDAQGENRMLGDGPNRPFVTMVPLVEIIAHSLGVKSIISKKVLSTYYKIIGITKTEVNLWLDSVIQEKLWDSNIDQAVIENINEVKSGNFCFYPGGFDGLYGSLKIGEKLDYENIKIIYG